MSAAAEEHPPPTEPAGDNPPPAPPQPVDPGASEEIRQAALRRSYGGHEPVRAGDVAAQLTHLPVHIRRAHEAAGQPTERYDATPQEGREYARALQRELMVERFRRLLAGLYGDYAAAELSGLYPNQDPNGKVTGWVVKRARGLLMTGDVGVGKTHAAVAIGNAAAHGEMLWPAGGGGDQWVRRPASVALWSEPDLIEATAPKKPGRDQVLADVLSSDLLILDELGAARRTEWTFEQISAVISARARQPGLRTVYTTNLPLDERGFADTPREQQPVEPNLTSRYDARIVDRLVHDAVLVRIVGRSRRRPVL
jgi:hypothetical protein